MTMQHAVTAHRHARSHDDTDCGEEWPRLSWRVALMNRLQDTGVDLGWRLKNIGLERAGLWLVHTCHRKNSITI